MASPTTHMTAVSPTAIWVRIERILRRSCQGLRRGLIVEVAGRRIDVVFAVASAADECRHRQWKLHCEDDRGRRAQGIVDVLLTNLSRTPLPSPCR